MNSLIKRSPKIKKAKKTYKAALLERGFNALEASEIIKGNCLGVDDMEKKMEKKITTQQKDKAEKVLSLQKMIGTLRYNNKMTLQSFGEAIGTTSQRVFKLENGLTPLNIHDIVAIKEKFDFNFVNYIQDQKGTNY